MSEKDPLPLDESLSDAVEEVQVTRDPGAVLPVQPSTVEEPVNPADVPKEGMHVPHPHADEVFDVTIIGGGPTGLFASFYAGMREMSVKIIDSLAELGGQVSALYPEKYIFDVGGFPRIIARDLVSGCIEQGLQFGPTVCLGEKVEDLQRQEDGLYQLRTNRTTHLSRTVIISAGVGAFAPRKLPNLPELDSLEGQQVFYFIKSLEQFRDQHLLIVGGGDSALDWALNLEPIARDITLIHRRDKWRAHEDSVRRLLASSVEVRTFHEIRSLAVDNGTLRGATLFDNRSTVECHKEIDAIILSLGFIANIGPIRQWGLQIQDGGIAVDATMATNLPGVFAAGDVTRYTGKLNLIATGFSEAAVAANYAKNFIDPHSRVFPGHSSEKSP